MCWECRSGTNSYRAPGATAFYWYSNAALTIIAPGSNNTNTYNTGISNLVPSVNPFYVTQVVGGINTCVSPSTPVVLTINQLPNKPIIGITGSVEFCFNPGVNSVTLTANTVTPPTITSYQWYKGGAPVVGATNVSITLGSASSQSGVYTVRAFGVNPTNCSGPLSDPVTILIHDLASFTLPTPVTVCENTNAVFTTSTTEPSVSYKWFESTDLGVSFNPVGGGPQYSGWLTNTLTILSTPYSYNNYQYKVEIRTPPAQGNCPFDSPPVILTVLPAPTANAGAALPGICQGGTSAALGGSVGGSATGGTWSTPAGGTFTPAATNLNATWTPPGAYTGTATLTLTTSGGSCGTTTASKTIVVNPNPTITLGANPGVCSGTTSANLTYSATTGIPNQYSIIYSGAALGAGFVNVANAALPATPISLVVPAAAPVATYTANLTVTNSVTGCVSGAYPISVTVNLIPTITLGANPAVCSGITTANLTYSATTGTPNRYSIVYSAAALGAGFVNVANAVLPVSPIILVVPAAAPAATYTANLTVTNNATGCVSSAYAISVIVNPNPTITLGANPGVCAGTTSANLTYSATTGTPNQYSIVYSGAALGAGFVNVTNAAFPVSPISLVVPAAAPVATYTANLTVTNSVTGCVSGAYAISVTVNLIPTITLGANPGVCSGTTSANLTYSATTGTPNQYSIVYSAAALGAGFVNVANAALPASPISLVVPAAAPVATYTANLTVTNSVTGCVSGAYAISVTVNPNPTITLGANPAVCSGTTTANLTYSATTGTPNRYSIVYSAAALGAGFVNVANAVLPVSPISLVVPAAAPAATYTANLTVTNNVTGCVSGAYAISVTVNPLPVPVIGGPTGPCLGSTVTYSTAPVAGHTYSWSVNNGTISGASTNNTVDIIWNLATGAGWVRVTETITATGCIFTTANYVINVNPGAPGSAGGMSGSNNVCYGQTGVSYSISAVANASNYVWTVPAGVTITSGQGTISILVDFTAGTSSPKNISVYAQNGCGNGPATTLVASIYAQLTPGTVGNAQTICYNTAPAALTELTAAAGGSVSYTYRWQDSPDNITFTNIVAGATGIGYSPPVLTSNKYYRRNVTDLSCGLLSSPSILITVNPNLTITLGANPAVCSGTTTANLTYSATTGTPNQYSIVYSGAALGAGFVNVANAALPVSPISLVVPAAAPAATYTANLTVTNSVTGCVSGAYAISVTVNPNPTITLGANPGVCAGTTTAKPDIQCHHRHAEPIQYNLQCSSAGSRFCQCCQCSITC